MSRFPLRTYWFRRRDFRSVRIVRCAQHAQPFASALFGVLQTIFVKQFRTLIATIERLIAFCSADETKIFAFRFADANEAEPRRTDCRDKETQRELTSRSAG